MKHTRTALALVLLAFGSQGLAQPKADKEGPAGYPSQATFPKENKQDVARYLSEARQIAGADLEADMRWRCLISPLDKDIVFGVQHDGRVPATRIFDNLYSVGQNSVSAYALDTKDGIILFDALNNEAEARDILVPNLKALGLDPARIRYVIATHGHGDHWGGAQYLQKTYGAKVVLSEADWNMIERPDRGGGPFASLVPPKRDIVAKDGDSITLGDTTVKLYVTPGHTPGTLSMIFPVFDKGKRYMAGLMGGTGGGRDAATTKAQITSLTRWQDLTKAANVEVMVTNHPVHMAATEKQVLIRYAMPGDGNPYIYGAERYQRYMGVMKACSKVQLGRMGEKVD